MIATKASETTIRKLEHARRVLETDEPTLEALADIVGLSASHLQRSFTARFGLSPAQFLAQRKLGALKSALRDGDDVSGALYDAGYGSPSRVYEDGAARLGMTPARYRYTWQKQQLSGQGVEPEVIGTAASLVAKVAASAGAVGYILESEAEAADARVRLIPLE